MAQTATVLITQSLRDVGAIDEEDSASTAQINNNLVVLNQIVQGLIAEGVGIYTKNLAFTTQTDMNNLGSAGYYSVGTGSAQPLEFQKAFLRVGGVDTPLDIATVESWADYKMKAAIGQPEMVFFDQRNQKVYCSPWPSSPTTMSLGFVLRQGIADITSSTTIDSYPFGAYEMLNLLLTARIAPTYGCNSSICQMWDAKATAAKLRFTSGDRQKSLSLRKSNYQLDAY